MKQGFIVKSNAKEVSISETELDLINKYTKRELKPKEIYAFTVVLCDNEIDREFEKFTKDALYSLSELFVGKTGILDHEMKSDNQTARIFDCHVEQVENRFNMVGEPYYRLIAKAYMPKCEKNNDFILDIDAGIKKEVSVGCSVNKVVCSVCGANLKTDKCSHIKGNLYNDKVCHTILDEPTDAYEWSFVAVPAQKEAGVIKKFDFTLRGGVTNMETLIKSLKNGESIQISSEQALELSKLLAKLEELAEEGKLYRDELQKDVVRLCALTQQDISDKVIESVAAKMTIDELKAFKKSYESKSSEVFPAKPQLTCLSNEELKCLNNEFKF